MGLDRRPDLIAHLLRLEGRSNQDESVEKVTLVEKSANVVREAFIKCLTDRSGTPGVQGKPEGRRVGIYLMANLCLKLLFQVFTRLHGVEELMNWPDHDIVRQASQCRADVCQYQRSIPPFDLFPRITTSHLPSLPRTLSLLE